MSAVASLAAKNALRSNRVDRILEPGPGECEAIHDRPRRLRGEDRPEPPSSGQRRENRRDRFGPAPRRRGRLATQGSHGTSIRRSPIGWLRAPRSASRSAIKASSPVACPADVWYPEGVDEIGDDVQQHVLEAPERPGPLLEARKKKSREKKASLGPAARVLESGVPLVEQVGSGLGSDQIHLEQGVRGVLEPESTRRGCAARERPERHRSSRRFCHEVVRADSVDLGDLADEETGRDRASGSRCA